MKRHIILLAAFSFFCTSAAAQDRFTQDNTQSPAPYTPQQIKEKFGVDVADGNYASVVKSILEWIDRVAPDEDYSTDLVLESLKEMALRLPEPAKGLVNFIIADFYKNYWQENRWKNRQRTSTPEAEGTIDTWDMGRLFAEAIKYFNLALEDKDLLQNTPLLDYDPILVYNNYMDNPDSRHTYSAQFFPTLYDFMAFSAIKAFSGELAVMTPKDAFVLNESNYFADTKTFVNYKIAPHEEASAKYRVITLYQQLLSFRLQEFKKNPSSETLLPLIVMDTERLKYVYFNGVYDDKEKLYERALVELGNTYRQYPESAYADYILAELYVRKGAKWASTKTKDDLRNKYVEAYALCDGIIKSSPKFTPYALNLQKEITAPFINFTLEAVNHSDEPFLALVNYRNVDNLYVRIYKATENFQSTNNREIHAEYDIFASSEPVRDIKIAMPRHEDYQPYSAQFMIDGLPQGVYVMFASTTPLLDEPSHKAASENSITSVYFQTSALTGISRSGDNRLFGLAGKGENKISQYYIMERKSGNPVPAAMLEFYTVDYNANRDHKGYYPMELVGSTKTDKEGIAYFDETTGTKRLHKTVVTDNKGRKFVINESESYHNYWRPNNDNNDDDHDAMFFTDRAIYRPGQTVHFKALLMKLSENGKNKLLPGYKLEVSLRDVNDNELETRTFTSNDYGAIAGSFVIPLGLLNGRMYIDSDIGEAFFQVEEYKRQTFEVQFDPVDKTYMLEQQVTITGKATSLAGYAVDNSTVKYHIVRDINNFLFPRIRYSTANVYREIVSGETETDANGKFSIDFKALANDIQDKNLAYTYTVTADITDINGETRSAIQKVVISNKPLILHASLPEEITDRTSLSFDLVTINLNDKLVSSDIFVTVHLLKTPNRILRNRRWDKADSTLIDKDMFIKLFPYDIYADEDDQTTYPEQRKVSDFHFKTNSESKSKLDLSSLEQEPAGVYKVMLKAVNAEGVEVEQLHYIRINSHAQGNKPAPITNMEQWVKVVKKTGEPGEEASFLVAGANKNTIMRYEISQLGRILETKTIRVGTTPQKISLLIKEEHRGGLVVQFLMVQDGRTYNLNEYIEVPFTNKKLDIAFTTFRDQLLPGEHEKWTLTIKNKDGKREMAEMVATLYDASLDAFATLAWPNFNTLYEQSYSHGSHWGRNNWNRVTRSRNYNNNKNPKGPRFQLPDVLLYRVSDNHRILFRNNGKGNSEDGFYTSTYAFFTEADVSLSSKSIIRSGVITGMNPGMNYESNPSRKPPEAEPKSEPVVDHDNIAMRQNFNETAFFYPKLRTNKEGEIIIEFTIPESLTRWKMLGFAHTKEMKVGSIENDLITQKQVAISANAPRFFREGDVIEFTAKVNNITENDLSGEAFLRLYDATNMQPLDNIIRSAANKNFDVKAGQSAGLSWTLTIPEGLSAITYRLTAQAGAHTDGEERSVPVMTNRIMVTETMPFYVRAKERKAVDFERMRTISSTTLRNHTLTLEFTSNPAWYAVQAMPYLMEYPHDCAEQVFSRFYANSLSASIANSSPRIKQIFELWRNAPEGKDALLSNLEKNQELKQVLLEETPWVMQAKSETERKKRVGLLFDLNRLGSEQRIAFDKLKKAQRDDGGFGWFDGLPASRYMTQHIITGIRHLSKLDALDDYFEEDAQAMVSNGLRFLNFDLMKEYESVKNRKDFDAANQHISYIQLHYLYTTSFDGHKPEDAAEREAFDFYYGQAKKYWSKFNIYGQGMAALAFHRYGDKTLAAEVVASLKKKAGRTDDMGMFWRENRAGYFWHEAPIETQALLIEAFDEITSDRESVEQMKIWLLRNKQTNDWKTTKATASACYALLMTGGNLLEESRTLDVTIGGVPLATAANGDVRPEAGTGYVKTSWSGSDIKPEMASLEVNNPNNSGIAWGALYWQYFEQLDKVTSAETDLRMEKGIFIKKNTPRGPELVAIKEGDSVNVGDLLTIRLVLRAHRDYEYVHLKDMRASGLEPTKTLSGYRYQDGLWYYESIKDASTNFFISSLKSGTYVFEYDLRVTHSGEFSNGITTFQCMYAPEFSAHSKGVRIKVE